MSKSIVFRDDPFEPASAPRKVLVTGAAGRIGSYFAEHAHDRYDLRLMVRGDEPTISRIEGYGEVVVCDLSDLEGLKQHCEGIDTILHLAADHRVYAPWEELLPNNIVGVYHLFEAAKVQQCRRVVFASSINAMNGGPHSVQSRSDDPVNPGNLYGVSKCFGESLCRFYASREGVSGIALRIGAFQTLENMRDPDLRIPSAVFLSPPDLLQMVVKCIDDLRLQFAIFNVLSNNRFNAFDISDAREILGYQPLDDAFGTTNA